MTKQKPISEANYETLLTQKQELEKQLNSLNAELDGSENAQVSEQINKLELEKERNSKELSIAENSLELLKKISADLTSKISTLSSGKSQELIEAVKKQRWFFFKNPKEIIFDTHTGIIWENLNYLQIQKFTNGTFKDESKTKNTAKIPNWNIASNFEYSSILSKKSKYPFLSLVDQLETPNSHRYFRIKGESITHFYRESDSIFTTSIFDSSTVVFVLYCNATYVNADLDPSNSTIYSIDEKAQMVLCIFSEQKWEPIFDQKELTDVFKKYYYERPSLIKSLAELEIKIKELEPKRKKLNKDFDFKVLLKEFDLKEINFSALQYYRNAVLWINELLDSLDDFESENSQLVQSMLSVQDEMMEDYKNDSDFKEEENNFFRDQKLKWRKIFDFGLDSLKDELISFRTEAEIKLKQIDDISISKNKISDLSKIEIEDRPDFYFFAEYTGNLIRKRMIKFNWFDEKSEDIIELLRHAKIWYEDYDVFKGKLKADFYGKCNKQSIDEEKFSEWFEEWTNERFLIVSKLFNLISDNIEENKLTEKTILELFEIAKDYREKLDEFYLGERLNIHQKFAFVDNGELQEKFEKEIKLNEITNEYSGKIENLMFDLETSAQKIIIARWAKEWLNLQIEEIVRFIEKSKIEDLTPVFKESLQEIKKLKTQNFEVFLNDVKLYSEAVKQRQDDFNSSIFRMRKEMSGKKEKGKKK